MLYEALTGQRPFEGEPEADDHDAQAARAAGASRRSSPAALPRTTRGCACDTSRARAADEAGRARNPGERLRRRAAPSTRRLGHSARSRRACSRCMFVGRRSPRCRVRCARRSPTRGLAASRARAGKLGPRQEHVDAGGSCAELGETASVARGPLLRARGRAVQDARRRRRRVHRVARRSQRCGTLDALAPRDPGALVRLFPVLRRQRALAEARSPRRRRRIHWKRAAAASPHCVACSRAGADATTRDLRRRRALGDADSAAFFAELIDPGAPGMRRDRASARRLSRRSTSGGVAPPANGGRRGEVRELEVAPLGAGRGARARRPARGRRRVARRNQPRSSRPGPAIHSCSASSRARTTCSRESRRAGRETGAGPSTAMPPVAIVRLVAARAADCPDAQAMLAVSSDRRATAAGRDRGARRLA